MFAGLALRTIDGEVCRAGSHVGFGSIPPGFDVAVPVRGFAAQTQDSLAGASWEEMDFLWRGALVKTRCRHEFSMAIQGTPRMTTREIDRGIVHPNPIKSISYFRLE